MPRQPPIDDDEREAPEPTARPVERTLRERADADDERLVPAGNVGGAAPTALGRDSGGNQPGPEAEDDLASLPEPEPPEPPEVGAVHVRDEQSRG